MYKYALTHVTINIIIISVITAQLSLYSYSQKRGRFELHFLSTFVCVFTAGG